MKQGARSPVVRGTGAFASAAPSGKGDGRPERRPYVRFARTYGVTRVGCDDVPEHCGRSDGRAASGGGWEGRAANNSTTPTPVTTAATIDASWVPQLDTFPGHEDAFTALASSHPDVIVPARRLLALAAATGRIPEWPHVTIEAAL